ncbi:MAG: zinc-binding dehydrogenase [Myxococcota bacterium]
MSETVRAVVFSAEGLTLAPRALRPPGPDDVVVRVTHTSLNAGEVRPPPAPRANGWDFAGTIDDPGSSDLEAGQRVCGFSRAREAWAEKVVVPARDLAPIPDGVSSDIAAALPVAAGTALAMVDAAGGALVGSRALVLGTTGGVGSFAVRLAHRAGCAVTAHVRRDDQVAYARSLGADEVVVGDIGDAGPFAVVASAVGGPTLTSALGRLESDGTAVVVGGAGGAEVGFMPLIGRGRAHLVGLNLYAHSDVVPPRRWLARLLRLVAADQLEVDPVDLGDWTGLDGAIERFRQRAFLGKGILAIG